MGRRTIAWAGVILGLAAASGRTGAGGEGSVVVGQSSAAASPTTSGASTATDAGQGGGTTTGAICPPYRIPGAVGGGIRYWGPPYWVTVGPNGPIVIGPPPPTIVVVNPQPWPNPNAFAGAGPLGGPVPPRVQAAPAAPAPRARRVDANRRDQLVTIGDRLFRAGNLKRAEERYLQAVKADPDAAAPRVRLAQVALAREDYAEAAQRFRESVDAEPDWLPRSNGIAVIYAEPADLDQVIGRLESHVLNQPGDRDAWLALGAQYFLAGQVRRAADVFARLSDRKADAALAAFVDATKTAK